MADNCRSIDGQTVKGQPKTTEAKKSCICGRYEGIMYTVLAGVSVVGWSSVSKYLKEISSLELSFYTFLFSVSLGIPLVVRDQRTLPNVSWRIVLLWFTYAVFQAITTIFRTKSFQLLPLGDASSIIFSTPIFTAVFGRIIFKDRITWMTIISLLLSVVGMLLTMKLPDLIITGELINRFSSQDHLFGCLYAMVAVITSADFILVLRGLRGVPVYFNILVQVWCSLIMTCLAVLTFEGFHQLNCSIVINAGIVATGVTSFLTSVFLNQALKTEDATTMGTVFRSTDILLSFLVQLVLFRDGVDAYNISGAAVVLTSGLLMPLQRWMEGRPQGSAWHESWLIR